MTCKRARIGRSSSISGNIDVFAHSDDSVGRRQGKSSPPSKIAKSVRHSPVEGRRPSILAAPSPIQANNREANCGFLDSCHFCKRKILQDAEVFMYSTFLAFCSSECRDVQILVDNERDKHSANQVQQLIIKVGKDEN